MSSWFSPMFVVFAFGLAVIHSASASDYAYPRFLILGPTGVGKSSLGNVLAGCEPSDEDCFFPVCNSLHSCTKNTTIAEAQFIGNFSGINSLVVEGNCTIIDTPGFGDSDLEDPALIAEMINVLKNHLEEANVIVLCFELGRLHPGILHVIDELESLFGRDRLWNNVIIEVTKWAYDAKSIEDRERRGITEESTLQDINDELKKNFHLNHSLPGIFLDSFAVYFLDDQVENSFFHKYAKVLWETGNAMKPFQFYTTEDILDQLHKCQIDNDCSNDVTSNVLAISDLTNSIANIIDDINKNRHDIIELTSKVFDNAQCINDLVETDDYLNERIDHFNQRLNNNTLKIVENKLEIQTNKKLTDINTQAIQTLTASANRHVSYCGYREILRSTGIIKYDELVTNTNTFKTGGLNPSTGIFTAPTHGIYLINIHFFTYGTGTFDVDIYVNGKDLTIFEIWSSSTDNDRDSAGRTITRLLNKDETVHLYLHALTGNWITRTTFCITLIK